MTAEKITILLVTITITILSYYIYAKIVSKDKKFPFTVLFSSMGLGLLSLGLISLLQLLLKKMISINLCTVLISAFGSLPAVITMLFLNII